MSSLFIVLTIGYAHVGVDQLRNATTQRNPTALHTWLILFPNSIRYSSWTLSSIMIPSACVQKNWRAPEWAPGTAPPESDTTCNTPETKNATNTLAYLAMRVPCGRCSIVLDMKSAGPFKLSCKFWCQNLLGQVSANALRKSNKKQNQIFPTYPQNPRIV